MSRDHALPAAAIGRFSRVTDAAFRKRQVWVQFRGAPKPKLMSAESVGFSNNLYSYRTHSAVVSVDDTWTMYERGLPKALNELEHWERGDGHVVLTPAIPWLVNSVPFVAGLFVRAVEFRRRYRQRFPENFWEQLAGVIDSKANATVARTIEFQRLLAPVMAATWFMYHAEAGTEFINNDLGIATTCDNSTGNLMWVVPLSPRTALVLEPHDVKDLLVGEVSSNSWYTVVGHDSWNRVNVDRVNRAIASSAQQFIFGSKKSLATRYEQVMDADIPVDTSTVFRRFPLSSSRLRNHELDWFRALTIINHSPEFAQQNPLDLREVNWEAVSKYTNQGIVLGMNVTLPYTTTGLKLRPGYAPIILDLS